MGKEFSFNISTIRFDEDYLPAETTRATTNFANLARGENRRDNLRKALQMIQNRFNDLAPWDNPTGDRYELEIDIVSATLGGETTAELPVIEFLRSAIFDRKLNRQIEGAVGNSFSSYLRDYDFSVVLPAHLRESGQPPADFGDLHGQLFQGFLQSGSYRQNIGKNPIICLSVSSSKTYHRTGNVHPILGVEYLQNENSFTDQYFAKMGLGLRFFMPPKSVAPLAFYFTGDLLSDYDNWELISAISVMESFQRIYRPEIYNANSVAGQVYRPNLQNFDFSLTRVSYDRVERNALAMAQGSYAKDHLLAHYRAAFAA